MSKKTTLWIGFFLCMTPIAYLSVIYPMIASEVPLHYNWKGEVDRMGSKSELITVVMILSGLNVLMLLLFTNMKKMNPQKSKVFDASQFHKFGLLVCTFLCLMQIYLLHSALNPETDSVKILLALCSLFFMFLGNFMHSLKHNYFAGIKTPWTLADEDNWNATHRIGGKIWFFGGLLSSILCLILPTGFATMVFMVITLTISLIPIAYSFIYFKRKKSDS